MKIAFDENIPPVLVKVFRVLAEDKHVIKCEIISARDYATPKDRGDVPWMQRFASDRGKIIVSGDKRIRGNPHEQKAYKDAGLMIFCFAPRWNHAKQLTKTAMLLHWWPKLEQYIDNFNPVHCWEIPYQWNWKDLRNVSVKFKGKV